jgi:hypothetical protein
VFRESHASESWERLLGSTVNIAFKRAVIHDISAEPRMGDKKLLAIDRDDVDFLASSSVAD